MIEVMNLDITIEQLCNSTMTVDILESINNDISYILNVVRKYIEGL